jgi:hypothetical protein
LSERGGINGIALGAIAAGILLSYAGIRGFSILKAVQNVVQGSAPKTGQTSAAIATQSGSTGYVDTGVSPAGGSLDTSGNDEANVALGRLLAGPYGWATGAQWNAINWIFTTESHWSDTVKNPNSDAAGIAQNINGFGPGYEEGNATEQILWGYNYIKSRYGTPVAAQAFHEANGYY